MIRKKVLNVRRIRRDNDRFSFIPHRFVKYGFLSSLDRHQLLLYLFLVLVSYRYGLSSYSYDSICSLLQMRIDKYIKARNSLIEKDLIASDGTLFQVLELPEKPLMLNHFQDSCSNSLEKLTQNLFKEV